MAPFTLLSAIRDAVKMVMEGKPLDHMIGPPSTVKVDPMKEQMVKMMAGVRTTAWNNNKSECLSRAFKDINLALATNGVLTIKVTLPFPESIYKDITNNTTQKDLHRLNRE